MLTDEQREFAEKNHNLIYSYMIRHKLCEDWYDILAITYCKAVENYDAQKGKFSTYCYFAFKNAYLLEMQNRRKKVETCLLTEDVGNRSFYEFENESHLNSTLKEIFKNLNNLDQMVIKMKLEGYSYDQIASECGLTKAQVKLKLRKFRKTYRYMFGDDND